MDNNPIKQLESEVHSLQMDMAQVGILVDRLDVTIEKLTEVSTTVARLLAVQENRLENQEKIADKLQNNFDVHKMETTQTVKEVYEAIKTVEKELQNDIDDSENKIIKKIEELKVEGSNQHSEINKRMTRLEKWMWIIIGGGFVLGFIVQNINLANIF